MWIPTKVRRDETRNFYFENLTRVVLEEVALKDVFRTVTTGKNLQSIELAQVFHNKFNPDNL